MIAKLGRRFTDIYQRFMPDAFVFALLLTFAVAISAFMVMDVALIEVLSAWYKGFWELLAFGMQMVLLVITGYSIALTPIAKRGIDALCRYIHSPEQVYFFVVLIGVLLCMISWGWVVITAVLARELAFRVKGVHFPYLIACVYFSMGSWVVGLSSSIPLLLNTPENFLIDNDILTETLATALTLGSSLNLSMILLFVILTPVLMYMLRPKEKAREIQDMISGETDQEASIEKEAKSMRLPFRTLSDTMDSSMLIQGFIALMGLVYICYHFYTKGFELDLNIIIFCFLMLGLILHRTPIRYVISMSRSSRNVSGILFQFPFYAGIMGIMKYTGLGDWIGAGIADMASLESLPALAYIAGGMVNFAIPSAGGEFAVMGPSIFSAAQELTAGLSPEDLSIYNARIALSMAYGESLTNALQPFFLLLVIPIMGAGIKLQARDVMGYLVIPFILFFLIQSILVTWLPL